MAGKIIADTLEHSTAGSIATNYVVNGSAKAWVNFQGSSTAVVRDGLNSSSLTDNGSGDYTNTFTSALANTDFATPTSSKQSDVYNDRYLSIKAASTTTTRSYHYNYSINYHDADYAHIAVFGDLA